MLTNRRKLLLSAAAVGMGYRGLAVANPSSTRVSDAASQASKLPPDSKPAATQDTFDITESLADRLSALQQEASALKRLRSLVVMHKGQVVLAENFSGPPVGTAVNVKSVSKSIVAALVGCAIEQGVVRDVSLTLGECIPDLLPRNADPRVPLLTIENLLTMQAGLQRTSGPFYGQWVASDNWINYVLTRPFVAEPGAQMLYSTGDWHVLGAALSRLGRASLLELSREWLGKPLDIEFAPWTKGPQGLFMGGNEMSLSPLHMVRFGELYRLGGLWRESQVFSSDWVSKSFTTRTHSPFSGDDYGYGWFLRQHGASKFAYARGYGGQFVHVLPNEGVVVAITSDWNRPARGGIYTEQLHRLVTGHLLKA